MKKQWERFKNYCAEGGIIELFFLIFFVGGFGTIAIGYAFL